MRIKTNKGGFYNGKKCKFKGCGKNDKDTKLLYAIGYLKASKLDKDDTITVIKHIFFEEI